MSSSYLGHGAKYWADRYFEQHTQTRLPDDPADLSWREKYLALEKECEHYQATLSEMRVEIEYLRSQQPTSIVADPDLQRKAEKWKLGYTRLAAALKEKEKQYDALSAEKQRLECHLQERELYRGKTAEQWAELYFSEQRNYQKATSDLQESDSEIQTLNSTIANYHKFRVLKSLKVIMCVPVKRLQQLFLREATLFILRMGPAHLLGSVHKICGELILLFIISPSHSLFESHVDKSLILLFQILLVWRV